MLDEIQIKVIITGKVQGVYYRVETRKTADQFGVKGYVKNLSNGCVEAVFKGEHPSVKKIIEWCRKGPAAAQVDNVSTQEVESQEDFETFKIRY